MQQTYQGWSVVVAQQSVNSVWWVQGLKEIDAYQSDPTKEKSSGRKSGRGVWP